MNIFFYRFAIFLTMLIISLNFSLSAHAASVLAIGSRGNKVTELQQVLTRFGYYSGNITGYFGTPTKSAIVKFQIANHILPANGSFGTKTKIKLDQLLKESQALKTNTLSELEKKTTQSTKKTFTL